MIRTPFDMFTDHSDYKPLDSFQPYAGQFNRYTDRIMNVVNGQYGTVDLLGLHEAMEFVYERRDEFEAFALDEMGNAKNYYGTAVSDHDNVCKECGHGSGRALYDGTLSGRSLVATLLDGVSTTSERRISYAETILQSGLHYADCTAACDALYQLGDGDEVQLQLWRQGYRYIRGVNIDSGNSRCWQLRPHVCECSLVTWTGVFNKGKDQLASSIDTAMVTESGSLVITNLLCATYQISNLYLALAGSKVLAEVLDHATSGKLVVTMPAQGLITLLTEDTRHYITTIVVDDAGSKGFQCTLVNEGALITVTLSGVSSLYATHIKNDPQFMDTSQYIEAVHSKQQFIALSYIQTRTSTLNGISVSDHKNGRDGSDYFMRSLIAFAKGPGRGRRIYLDLKATAGISDGSRRMSHIKDAYVRGTMTAAVLDSQDSATLSQIMTIAASVRRLRDRDLLTIAGGSSNATMLDFKPPHAAGSFWTRLWTAQELLLSGTFSYWKLDSQYEKSRRFTEVSRKEVKAQYLAVLARQHAMYIALKHSYTDVERNMPEILKTVYSRLDALAKMLFTMSVDASGVKEPMAIFAKTVDVTPRYGKHILSLTSALGLLLDPPLPPSRSQDILDLVATGMVRQGIMPIPNLCDVRQSYCYAPSTGNKHTAESMVSTLMLTGLKHFEGEAIIGEAAPRAGEKIYASNGTFYADAQVGRVVLSRYDLDMTHGHRFVETKTAILNDRLVQALDVNQMTLTVMKLNERYSLLLHNDGSCAVGYIATHYRKIQWRGFGTLTVHGADPSYYNDNIYTPPFTSVEGHTELKQAIVNTEAQPHCSNVVTQFLQMVSARQTGLGREQAQQSLRVALAQHAGFTNRVQLLYEPDLTIAEVAQVSIQQHGDLRPGHVYDVKIPRGRGRVWPPTTHVEIELSRGQTIEGDIKNTMAITVGGGVIMANESGEQITHPGLSQTVVPNDMGGRRRVIPSLRPHLQEWADRVSKSGKTRVLQEQSFWMVRALRLLSEHTEHPPGCRVKTNLGPASDGKARRAEVISATNEAASGRCNKNTNRLAIRRIRPPPAQPRRSGQASRLAMDCIRNYKKRKRQSSETSAEVQR